MSTVHSIFCCNLDGVLIKVRWKKESSHIYLLKIEYGWNFWPKVLFTMIMNTIKKFFWNPKFSDELILLHKSKDFSPKIQIQYQKWHSLRMEGFQKKIFVGYKSCVKHGSTNANLKFLEAELATNAQEIWVNGPSVNEKPVNPKGKLLKFHKNSGKPTVSWTCISLRMDCAELFRIIPQLSKQLTETKQMEIAHLR